MLVTPKALSTHLKNSKKLKDTTWAISRKPKHALSTHCLPLFRVAGSGWRQWRSHPAPASGGGGSYIFDIVTRRGEARWRSPPPGMLVGSSETTRKAP